MTNPYDPQQVVITDTPRTSHGLHLLLTLLTFGGWLPIWIIVAIVNEHHCRQVSIPTSTGTPLAPDMSAASPGLPPHTSDHGDGCPGCQADKLTGADKEFLTHRGWSEPGHTTPAAPRLAEPPDRRSQQVSFWLAVGLVLPLFLLAAPITACVVTALVVGLLVWWRRHHVKNHREFAKRCRWCRSEREKQAHADWANYRALMARERARLRAEWDAANYRRLRDQQQ